MRAAYPAMEVAPRPRARRVRSRRRRRETRWSAPSRGATSRRGLRFGRDRARNEGGPNHAARPAAAPESLGARCLAASSLRCHWYPNDPGHLARASRPQRAASDRHGEHIRAAPPGLPGRDRSGACALGTRLTEAKEDHRDVILASPLVRGLHEASRGLLERFRLAEDRGQLGVGDHGGQPIRA